MLMTLALWALIMNHCSQQVPSNTPRTSDAQSNKVGPIHQLGADTFAQTFRNLYLCANKALIHILVTSGYSVYIVKF